MGLLDKIKNNPKKSKIQIDDRAYGGFVVSKNVIAGRPIKYTYRVDLIFYTIDKY